MKLKGLSTPQSEGVFDGLKMAESLVRRLV